MSGGTLEGQPESVDVEAIVRAGGIGHVAVPGAREEILRIANGGNEGPVMAYRGIFAHDTQVPQAAMGDAEYILAPSKVIR